MKIPYSLTAAVALEKRREHMVSAIARGLPRLDQVPIDDSKTMHVACYGPSLRDTWQQLQHPIISMSGATRFLADRGVIADYHIDMDPRPHKLQHVIPPIPGVTYLIASVCTPEYFDVLKEERVVLWHPISSNETDDLAWLATHDVDQLLISTGSNIGLAALQIGGLLGYRHFEVHGMDGSFAEDGMRHAAEHRGKVQPQDQVWQAGNHPYYTSKIMANGVAETINSMRVYPMFCVFHGRGLTQALIREEQLPNACCVDEAEKVERIRTATARFVSIPPLSRKAVHSLSPWDAFGCAVFESEWLMDLQVKFAAADLLREKAKFNTGSISLETGLQLRALCHWKQPKVVVEIGTFIGKSTQALHADHIYTCDKDNDCVEATDHIKTHPYCTSTDMLTQLQEASVQVDLFFLDGRLTDADIPLIRILSKPDTVYVVDDYHEGGKGQANVEKLQPLLPNYGFVGPYSPFAGRSTLAMLVPFQL